MQESLKISTNEIRDQFPVLQEIVNGHQLVYFDNAATTQKPDEVIQALAGYYQHYNSNIHRGIHSLAEKATRAFEETRKAVGAFINSAETEEIVFTKGTTDGINLVASAMREMLRPGDEVIVSGLEHHSNMVPWQNACERSGATLKIIPFNDRGELEMKSYYELLNSRTRLVAFNHASNALGTINPAREIIKAANSAGAWTLVDGAQAVSHMQVDVQELGADFYSFSGHKMYGPTGTGILYGRRERLEEIPPYQYGGEMIKRVTYQGTTYNDIPYKFEAGTPHIAGIIGLGAAVNFINRIGRNVIKEHEDELLAYGHEKLAEIDELKFYGTADKKVSVISFLVRGLHPFDIGQMLDARGIAVRTGHHCTEPIMDTFGIDGTVRASFAVYNTREEIDKLADGLKRVISFMK